MRSRGIGMPLCGFSINVSAQWQFFLPPGWREYNRASLEEVCAFQWISANRLALDAKRGIPENRWIQVRYEDLFERPVEMFRDLFARLDLPFDQALEERCSQLALRPTSIVKGAPQPAKWKEHNPAAIERILPLNRPMMARLGYAASLS